MPPRARLPLPGRPPRPPGSRDRYLDAAVDRVLVAAIDIADACPDGPAIPPVHVPGRIASPADLDVAAVRTVLDAILMRGWGPPLPWHGRMDVEQLALARVARWRDTAQLLAAATRPGRSGALDDEVWTTARLVAGVAAEAREERVDERSGLAGVLDRVRRGLEEPGAAWDDSLMTVVVARPSRFRLRTGFDGRPGHLLWSANPATATRWGRAVDHFDLPVPLPLARHVHDLVARYAGDPNDPGAPRFAPDGFAAFREDYLMTVDELRRLLGPAYVVEERAGLGAVV